MNGEGMEEEVEEGRTEYRYLVHDEEEEEEVQYVRGRRYVSPVLVVSRRCVVFAVLCVLALLSLAAYMAYVAQTLPAGAARVTTPCATFRGRRKNGAYSFKGVPYAAPPVGERRWAPPAEPACGSELMDAGRFRSQCVQVAAAAGVGATGSVVAGHEDCLYINVWTPSLRPDAKLPVVVWIHGGRPHMLSGDKPGDTPTEEMAARTDAVYVTFNHRLNAFGFMALHVLREGSPRNTSGNYGVLDQIFALKWIQSNINLFGGDPGRVTIFGQSSGGASVWTLMASPLAKDLFHAAVVMSGPSVSDVTLEQAESHNMEFLERTGCRDVTCLRGLSTTQVLQAVRQENSSWTAEDWMDLPSRGHLVSPVSGGVPVVDGYVLPAPLFEVLEKGDNHNDVPLVVGTTEQEADFRPAPWNVSTWTWDDYRWFVTGKLQTFGQNLSRAALDLYPSSAPCPTKDRCPERAFTTMVSDIRVTCPSNHLARRAAAALRSPVYRYVVTHTPSGPVNASRDLMPFPSRFSFHGLDAVAFFGALPAALGKPPSDGDRSFQDLLTRHLVGFAKTGRMEDEWPVYPSATALLSDRLTAVHDYSAARCRLWKDNGLDAYAWTS